MSWTDPREDEGPDPLFEGAVDDPDEVEAEENLEEVDEDEAVP